MARYITDPMAWEYTKFVVGPLCASRVALVVTKQVVELQSIIQNFSNTFHVYVS